MAAPAQRPTLVASPSVMANQIRAFAAEATGRPVDCFTFDDCRQHLAWNRPGLLMLLAADEGDWAPLADVAREIGLRQSTLTVAIVQTADADCGSRLDTVIPASVARFHWPAAAEELAAAVRAAPATGTGAPKEELADRLLSLTPSLAPLAGELAEAANCDLTVLLTGETGTGKTFLARLLHDYSPRRNHPFMMIPCGAQSANLFESSFFGHVKGAFTSAHQAQRGKFAAAGKGTILLDEIDTLGLEQQASLLRVIETGEYEQVGGHVTLHSEARIIAASNWDLEAAVEDRKLREDLYYRLNVLSFRLPALRERPEDIAPLARAFAAQFSVRFRRPLTEIDPEAMATLETYSWPGNIRQLENVIQRAVAVPGRGPSMRVSDLPESIRHGGVGSAARQTAAGPYPIARPYSAPVAGVTPLRASGLQAGSALMRSRADHERQLIGNALERCGNNRSSAARALGVSRVTLHKKIKKYGLGDRS